MFTMMVPSDYLSSGSVLQLPSPINCFPPPRPSLPRSSFFEDVPSASSNAPTKRVLKQVSTMVSWYLSQLHQEDQNGQSARGQACPALLLVSLCNHQQYLFHPAGANLNVQKRVEIGISMKELEGLMRLVV